MKKLISILMFLTLATSASAFQFINPQAFNQPNPVIKFFSKLWECKWHISCYNKLGSFTTLSSTDNINNFPTTYNANLTKTIEVGTTSVASITTLSNLTSVGAITTLNSLTSASSLATVGTITSGTWSGTAIAVGKGGTGTTSPSIYQVLLGNGANGLTVASSTGTSGQFLTSNGSGAYPSWQTSSIDQTQNYNYTGTTFNVKNLNASSTVANPLVLNGVSFNTPTTQGASSTALLTNGSGNLTWGVPTWATGATSTPAGITGSMVYTHSLGRVPNFIKVSVQSACDPDGTTLASACSSVGTATSTASQYDTDEASGCTADSCTSFTAVGSVQFGTIINLHDPSGGSEMVGSLTAMTSTTFTINITTNSSAGSSGIRNIIWETY